MSIKDFIPRNLGRRMRVKLSFIPDKVYISIYYFAATGRLPNLKNPKLFSEKQQWLKLNDIHPEYSTLVDKLMVNEYVESILGPGHVFPVLGKWKSFDEIGFDTLPNQFVLKCNHDSGSTKVIRDKSKLTKEDIDKLKSHFDYD